MKIERCFEILELDPTASMDDVRQAYRDMVSIWHPDRFSANPRLRSKAELKLKEINQAYGAIRIFLSGERTEGAKPSRKERDAGGRDKAEILAEAGTRMILNVCSFVYHAVRSLGESRSSGTENRSGRG